MPCSQHLWRNIQPPPLCQFLLQHNGALALRSVLLQWTLFVLMYPHYLGPQFSLLLPVAMVSPCGGEHGLTWREKLSPSLKLRQGVTYGQYRYRLCPSLLMNLKDLIELYRPPVTLQSESFLFSVWHQDPKMQLANLTTPLSQDCCKPSPYQKHLLYLPPYISTPCGSSSPCHCHLIFSYVPLPLPLSPALPDIYFHPLRFCIPSVTPNPNRHLGLLSPVPPVSFSPLPYLLCLPIPYSPYCLWVSLFQANFFHLDFASCTTTISNLCFLSPFLLLPMGPFISFCLSNPTLPSLSHTLLQLPHSLSVKIPLFVGVWDKAAVSGQSVTQLALMWVSRFRKGEKKNIFSLQHQASWDLDFSLNQAFPGFWFVCILTRLFLVVLKNLLTFWKGKLLH